MTIFEFTAHDIQAGYSDNGFSAGGLTTEFGFDEQEYLGHPLPRLRGIKLRWSISAIGGNAWALYEDVVSANRAEITSRAAEITHVLGSRLCGLFLRWEPEEAEVSLSFLLPPDPAFASFIMGVIAAERSLSVVHMGFQFASEGRDDAAAPSVSGFMDRREPLFVTDRPILRLK